MALAKRFSEQHGLDLDDCLSVAVYGLGKGILSLDRTRKVKPLTFLWRVMHRELLDELKSNAKWCRGKAAWAERGESTGVDYSKDYDQLRKTLTDAGLKDRHFDAVFRRIHGDTFYSIAKDHGVCQESVRDWYAKGLAKVKSYLEGANG